MRGLSLIALVAVASLIAFGCGSGGDGSSDTAAQGGTASNAAGQDETTTPVKVAADLTRAELIAKGDKICEETDEEQEVALKAFLKEHLTATSSPAGQAEMVKEAGLPPIQVEAERLAALGAPAGDEEKVGAIITGIEKALEEGEDDPASLLGGAGNPFNGVGKQAAKYGFSVCSNAL